MNLPTRGAGDDRLTVLTDADCPRCRSFAAWLGQQALLVPLEVLPAGRLRRGAAIRRSTTAAPRGGHRRRRRRAGGTQERAWVMCLWGHPRRTAAAERLATRGCYAGFGAA